jgi:hypothetical protein
MAFRFRKTIKLGKGFKLNLSKSGISASVGKPGATLNFGKRGARTTVGLPGTGLSYSSQLGSAPKTPSKTFTPLSQSNSSNNKGCLSTLFGIVAMPFRMIASLIRSLMDPAKRRSSLILIGVLFASCFVCVGISSAISAISGNPTHIAPVLIDMTAIYSTANAAAWLPYTQTAAAAPSITSSPTNTIIPTDTPVPLPTLTTAPTWTPFPTATEIIFVPIIPTQRPPSNPNPSLPSVCPCSLILPACSGQLSTSRSLSHGSRCCSRPATFAPTRACRSASSIPSRMSSRSRLFLQKRFVRNAARSPSVCYSCQVCAPMPWRRFPDPAWISQLVRSHSCQRLGSAPRTAKPP